MVCLRDSLKSITREWEGRAGRRDGEGKEGGCAAHAAVLGMLIAGGFFLSGFLRVAGGCLQWEAGASPAFPVG